MTSYTILPSTITKESLIKRMLIGAAIGLIVISTFVFSVDHPKPEWGDAWRIKPLILTPIITAIGILSFYLKDFLRPKSQLANLLVIFISAVLFVISIWMGIVLGLNGTLWD